MADRNELWITGLGATTPVGLSAPASAAALRAGIARITEIPGSLVSGEQFDKQPVRGGRVPLEWFASGPTVEEWPGHSRFFAPAPPPPEKIIEPGAARLRAVGIPAAREAWVTSGAVNRERERGRARVGIYLGLDEHDDDSTGHAIADALGLDLPYVVTFPRGRAATFAALRHASKDLLADSIDQALVGGVDSLLRPEVLRRLEDSGKLRSATHPEAPLPGEAAAFLVVERAADVPAPAEVFARLGLVALGEEPTAGTEKPNQARALSALFRRIREAEFDSKTRWPMICDLNGDRLRAMEWAMASLRAFGDLPGSQTIDHPADCIGDVGAASGALSLVWSAYECEQSDADEAGPVLLWGASEGALRGVAVLRPVEERAGRRRTSNRADSAASPFGDDSLLHSREA